jgi:hypothetical protein
MKIGRFAAWVLGTVACSCSSGGHGTSGNASNSDASSGAPAADADNGTGVASDAGSEAPAPAADADIGTGVASDGGTLFNPTEVARVSGWLSNPSSGLLSYAYTNIDMYFPVGTARDTLVDSIVGACSAFAPRLAGWQEYCEALEASEIVAESSYNPGTPSTTSASVVFDGYATANGSNDPTVGLLQIRYSSTVHDFNYYGPIATIEAIGCPWPASLATQADVSSYWRTAGGTTANLAFMENPACNIPLAAWYVWMNATGNGGANAVYANNYCAGDGIAATIVVGLLSYLEGPAFTRPADASNSYVTGIKSQFGNLLGGLPSPDPFGVTLSPEVSVFCK